ncbi:MAG: hypothetical protein D3921_13655 [Candidatus Electrothrix sp. AW1]|nr:hypothetical protein [Candidatus Electrothrix sp. AX1]MCI5183538.1 hypothetical protein [Candidatus Electrothrix gigas]
MFIEVCLLSLGVFTGSELYKTIAHKRNHTQQKKEEPEIPSLSTQNNSTLERRELSSALESLTQEVVELRTDLSNYINANKEPPVQAGAVAPSSQQATQQQESSLPSSIFEKLIEENISLRKKKTGE